MGLFDGIAGLDDYDEPPNTGYDDSYDEYEDLDSKKTKEQIRKLQIENEKALRNLVEKSLVISIIGEVGQAIQENFIDIPKRNSNIIANKLGIPAKEKNIEIILADLIENGVAGVIANIERLCGEGTFE